MAHFWYNVVCLFKFHLIKKKKKKKKKTANAWPQNHRFWFSITFLHTEIPLNIWKNVFTSYRDFFKQQIIKNRNRLLYCNLKKNLPYYMYIARRFQNCNNLENDFSELQNLKVAHRWNGAGAQLQDSPTGRRLGQMFFSGRNCSDYGEFREPDGDL